MGEQKEIDDSSWQVKLSAIKHRKDIVKSLELNVIIRRSWFDSHKREHNAYFLQKIQVYIPDTPEFFPLYLSVMPFEPFYWKRSGRKEQKLIFHNLFEGATQSIDIDVKSLAFAHARIKLIGKETPISTKEAIKMVKKWRNLSNRKRRSFTRLQRDLVVIKLMKSQWMGENG